MKKIMFVFPIAVMIIAACQTKPEIAPVDTEAAKVSVTNLLDKYKSAWNKRDVNTLTALLADNGLFCGSDPSEFWDKKTLSDAWGKALPDTSLKINYNIDRQEIRIANDCNSAIAIEQSLTFANQKIPWRLIFHIVKTNENWMIDFISWSLIPKNEDLGKLNKVLE
jgi:hypothetical protein